MRRSLWVLIAAVVLGPVHAAEAGRLIINRDRAGRVTRMRLPDGLVRRYSHDPAAPALDALPAFRPRRVPADLAAQVAAVRADEGYAEFIAEIDNPEAYGGTIEPLSAEAIAGIEAQIAAIRTCAPAGAALLSGLLSDGRIRSAPSLSDIYGAVVPATGEAPILLGPNWTAYLSAPGEWFPFQNKFGEDSAEERARYFGDSTVTEARLGSPSRRWFGVLGLLHEAGHTLQRQRPDWDDLRDYASYRYGRTMRIYLAQGQFGMVSPDREREYRAAERIFERWKTDVEAGATHFALDALAGCPARL